VGTSSGGASGSGASSSNGGPDGGGGAFCTGTGPSLIVGTTDAGTICGGDLAQTTFRFGVCVCEDMALASVLETDGYNSAQGVYVPGQTGGSVGVNGTFRNLAVSDVGGALWTGLDLRPIGAHQFRAPVHVGGTAAAAGDIHIYDDAYITQDIAGIRWIIDGDLHIPAASTVGLAVTAQNVVREPVSVPLPCPCDPSDLVDVTGFIASHQNNNDNAAIGLTPDAWANVNGALDVTLPCGRYYVNTLNARAEFILRATGRTALYIAGDLATLGIFRVELETPEAELDIFVGGNLVLAGVLDLGDEAVASRIRTYVAGAGDIALGGDLHLGGNLYAPRARLLAAGPLEVFGAVFVRRLVEAGVVKVHYDRDVLNAGDSCETPRTDAGIPVGNCQTCEDCGNQACRGGTCGTCQVDADCCAPLLCVSGTCTLFDG